MDFEVELAFAIGSVTKNVSEADALSYVAGYMIADDVSERSLQKGGPGEWIKAKATTVSAARPLACYQG